MLTQEQLDVLVSPSPLPFGLFPGIPEETLLSWQRRAVRCVRCICIKQALYLSLVSHTKVPERTAITAALSAHLMESEDNLTEQKIDAFLEDQFSKYNIDLKPNARFLASEDFSLAFGFKDVFQSSIAAHLYKFQAGTEWNTNGCVACEALPELRELAGEFLKIE